MNVFEVKASVSAVRVRSAEDATLTRRLFISANPILSLSLTTYISQDLTFKFNYVHN